MKKILKLTTNQAIKKNVFILNHVSYIPITKQLIKYCIT
jgi:hypothetical protein